MKDKKYLSHGKLSDAKNCFICGTTTIEDNPIEFSIKENIYAVVHDLCFDGLRTLVSERFSQIPETSGIDSLIKEIEGHPVLIRRNLAFKGSYILGYLAFFREEPKYTAEVSEWLNANGVRITNTSDYLRKLMLDGRVARVPSGDNKLRYVITEIGYRELMTILEEG